MAVYPMPKCGISAGTSRETIDALQLERTTSGSLRGRSYWTAPKHRYELKHAACSIAEADALEASYAANRAANSMTFVWVESGATITARWVAFKRAALGRLRVSVETVLETI